MCVRLLHGRLIPKVDPARSNDNKKASAQLSFISPAKYCTVDCLCSQCTEEVVALHGERELLRLVHPVERCTWGSCNDTS